MGRGAMRNSKKLMRGSSDDSGLFFIAIVMGALWYVGAFTTADEITEYRQYKKCNNGINCKWTNSDRISYRINFESQNVVYWETEDVRYLSRYDDCVVGDIENWECEPGYGLTRGIKDGNWNSLGNGFRNVSFIEWWIYQLIGGGYEK